MIRVPKFRKLSVFMCLSVLLLAVSPVFGQGTVEELHDPQDQYMYAHGLQDRKLYDRAEKLYRDFLAANGGHRLAAEAHVNLILCLHEQMKTDDMLACIAEFRKNFPTNAKLEALTSWEADAYYQKKDYPRAAESFRRLRNSKDESLAEYSTYLLAMCIRYQNGKDTEEVLDLFRTLAKGELRGDRPWRAYALYQLSWRALTARELEEAEVGFKRLSGNESVSPEIREASMYRLGEVCNARGHFADALAAYELCIGLYPDGASSREVRKRRVMLLFDQGKVADALEKAEDWHRRYAEVNDYEMDYVHGLCLFNVRRYPEARNVRRYPEARPFFMRIEDMADVPPDLRRTVKTYIIYCLMEEKSFEQAGLLIDAFVKEYPQSAEKAGMLQHRGRIFELEGKLQDAENSYRQALALYKGNLTEQVRSHELLISMFMKAKEWQKAADELIGLSRLPGVAKPASFLLQAAFMLVSAVGVFLLLRDDPAQKGLRPFGEGGAGDARTREKEGPERLPKLVMWMLAGMMLLVGGAGQAFSVVCSKFLSGGLADRFGSKRCTSLLMVLFILGCTLVQLMNGVSLLWCFAPVALMGFGASVYNVGPPLWAGDLSDKAGYPKLLKWLQIFYNLGGILFSAVPGIIADHTGEYKSSYLLIAAMMLLSLTILRWAYWRGLKKA